MHILLKPHCGLRWQPQLNVLKGFKAKSRGVPSWAYFALWLSFRSAAGSLGVFTIAPGAIMGWTEKFSPSPPGLATSSQHCGKRQWFPHLAQTQDEKLKWGASLGMGAACGPTSPQALWLLKAWFLP